MQDVYDAFRIDTSISNDDDTPSSLDTSTLPLPFERLPCTVRSLQDCARHCIESLLQKEKQGLLTREDEDAMDDGFVICDLNVVFNKLLAWRCMFPNVKPFFALKCNPDVMVAHVLGQCSANAAGFDCASVPEIEMAMQATNQVANRIIYANPQRAENDLETALRLNVQTLTFDGPEELHKVHRIHQALLYDDPNTSPPDMILRILVPDESSSVPLGEKFGVPMEEVEALARLAIVELELSIVGISFHCGSGNHNPEAYKTAIRLAWEAKTIVDLVFKATGRDERCWLLDIGGGFPGLDGLGVDDGRFAGVSSAVRSKRRLPNAWNGKDGSTTTTIDIAQAIRPQLDALYSGTQTTFIAEPGRYYCEAAFALCSRIYRVRLKRDEKDGSISHCHYYIAQGVQGLFKDCLLCNESFVPSPLSMNEERTTSPAPSDFATTCHPSTVHGPSGEEHDTICQQVMLPRLQTGDWLLFDRVGAYTLSIASRSECPPIRYVVGGARFVAR